MNGGEIFVTGAVAATSWEQVVLSLLLAFGLAQVIGTTYVWTFRGMSYAAGLVHAMVLGSTIAAMLMLAIGNSIAAGLGIAGGLALVRFRTALRDPRDMMFVFASLGVGPASRVGALLWDTRYSLLTVALAGFGRAIAEVGAVMIVGGNIDGVTRVMTTAIALETSKGDLALALGLGVVLLAIALAVNAMAFGLRALAARHAIVVEEAIGHRDPVHAQDGGDSVGDQRVQRCRRGDVLSGVAIRGRRQRARRVAPRRATKFE